MLFKNNELLQFNIAKAETAPDEIEVLKLRLNHLNNNFQAYTSYNKSKKDEILHLVSSFCQNSNLILKELPVTTILYTKDYNIESNTIIAEGTYENLLKLLYELELNSKVSRISSIVFKSYKDQNSKKAILALRIYLQNIHLNKKINDVK